MQDVTRCYNWILDNRSAEDRGGPVVPKTDCPHLKRHVRLRVSDKERLQIVYNEGGSLTLDVSDLEGNVTKLECQHYRLQREKGSRKRPRSEDGSDGSNGSKEGGGGEEGGGEGAGVKSGGLGSNCPRGENWLCLECGALLCSRYANGQAPAHHEDTKEEAARKMVGEDESKSNSLSKSAKEEEPAGHCIAVSLTDLSVWCYECNAYLQHPSLEALTKYLEGVKFGKEGESKTEVEKRIESEIGSVGKNMEGDESKESTGENHSEGGLRAGTEMENKDAGDLETPSITKSGDQPPTSKRKVQPRKLPPEQLGTTMLSSHHQQQQQRSSSSINSNTKHSDNDKDVGSKSSGPLSSSSDSGERSSSDADVEKSNQDDVESEHGDSSSSSSSDEDPFTPDIGNIASLILRGAIPGGAHGDALRAYFSGQVFEQFAPPQDMPPPPSFPGGVAAFLKDPQCRSVVVLAGAGMSVSSGIPDFRSAGVGLYDTLRPELLTATEEERELIGEDPTLALDRRMFLMNPLPMLETKRDFILGTHEKRWKATLAHRFVELLHTKLGKLTRLYTQNIDGLEAQCPGLPRDMVVNVHGSMGAAACENCGAAADFDKFCEDVKRGVKDISGRDAGAPPESTPVTCAACGAPAVKPTIVLFRGSMPGEFHAKTARDLPGCDLLIVMGTSLTVAPANSLVYRVPPTALRMVMNNEPIGRRLGIEYGEDALRDVFAQGHSDETCLALAEEMGWLDDLASIVDEMPDSSARLLRERLAQRQHLDSDAGGGPGPLGRDLPGAGKGDGMAGRPGVDCGRDAGQLGTVASGTAHAAAAS